MPNPLFRTAPAPDRNPRQASGVRLVDAETRTFEWVAKARDVTGQLTDADLKEMQRLNLTNIQAAIAAKALWRDGIKLAKWPAKIGLSLSYCKKLSMAFGRAEKRFKVQKQH